MSTLTLVLILYGVPMAVLLTITIWEALMEHFDRRLDADFAAAGVRRGPVRTPAKESSR